MTFDAVEALLPSGFHDAFLRGVSLDYPAQTAQVEFEVWVGDLDAKDHARREAYRHVRLHFSGLALLTVDAPNQEFLPARKNGIPIDLWPPDTALDATRLPDEPLPEGTVVRTFFFTDDINSYLHLAARDVTLEWLSEPRPIY